MHEKSHVSLGAFDNWKCQSFRWELGEDRLAGTQVQPRTWGLEAEPPPPQVPQLAPAPHTTPSKGKVFWSCNSKKALLAPNSTQGWKCLLFSQWTHGQQAYPGLKGWQKDVQTFQLLNPPVYSSYAFSLVEGRTLVHTYPAYPRRISVCQSISANPAHSHKGPNSHKASSLGGGSYRIAPQLFRAMQWFPACFINTALLQAQRCHFSACSGWINEYLWQFKDMLDSLCCYFVPKFLGSRIRSLCSEVWSYQLLYFPPHFYPFCIFFK